MRSFSALQLSLPLADNAAVKIGGIRPVLSVFFLMEIIIYPLTTTPEQIWCIAKYALALTFTLINI